MTRMLANTRPNVVLVFMDDMGYGDLGCMGSPLIKTPRMDQLATEGMTFTQMYSAAPTCTPSRAALLTGRYAQRVGLPRVLFPEDRAGLDGSERTIADVLGDAGYRCGVYGKWHLGHHPEHNPVQHGFDEYVGLPYSNDMEPLRLLVGAEVVDEPVDQSLLTRRYTDEAIDFIDRHRDEPFFVYLAHTMPHIPLHVEEPFRGKSAAGTYGDTVECLDYHIGRLVDHIDSLGLGERTLVLVTSDNGPWFEGSTGGLRGRKIDSFEGGVRMPFIARWTGRIEQGSCVCEPVGFVDLMPTVAGLAGAAAPAERPIDGVDIGQVFAGLPAPRREALYFFHHWTLNAVRSGRWKLHVDRHPSTDLRELPQLFDIDSDPQESYNLANLYPDELARLTALADRFRAEIEAQRADAERKADPREE